MLVIFLMLSAAVAFPAENITQQESKNITTLQFKITVTVEDIKAGRQDGDVEDAVDVAAENGGLQLASRIVNILLREFSRISQALAGTGGGGANANANGGTAGGTGTGTGSTGTAGGATPPRRRQPKIIS